MAAVLVAVFVVCQMNVNDATTVATHAVTSSVSCRDFKTGRKLLIAGG